MGKRLPSTFSSYEEFSDKTGLLVSVILDSITSDIFTFIGDEPESRKFYERMREPEVEEYFEQRLLNCYNGNQGFRNGINRVDPRDYLYSFMRHWMAAKLMDEFPLLYQRLPSSFENGEPLH